MNLYICIYNTEKHEIQFPEVWPMNTDEDRTWAQKNSERMALQCALYRPEEWTNYYSTEGPFEWPEEIEE